MYQRQRALAPLLVAAALTLAACTNSPSADPTNTSVSSTETSAEAPPTSSEATQPTTSSTPPTSSPPAPSTTSRPNSTAPTTSMPPTSTAKPPKVTDTRTTPAAEQRFPVKTVKGFPSEYLPYAKDAEAAYRGMMDTWDRAMHNPNAENWPEVMKKYMAGAAYDGWVKGFEPFVTHKLQLIGYTEARAKVTDVGQEQVGTKLLTVGVRSCVADGGTQVIDEDGKPVPSSGSGPSLWVIGVKKGPAGWRVYDLIQSTTKGKAIPCDKDLA